MSLPIPAVTPQQLVEARRILGPVGVRPFRTYVQKTYGPLTEEMAREFLRMPVRRGATAGGAITAQDTRMQNMAHVFAPHLLRKVASWQRVRKAIGPSIPSTCAGVRKKGTAIAIFS